MWVFLVFLCILGGSWTVASLHIQHTAPHLAGWQLQLLTALCGLPLVLTSLAALMLLLLVGDATRLDVHRIRMFLLDAAKRYEKQKNGENP